MGKVIILSLLAGLSISNCQTAHFSIIEGSATGNALNINGPTSGNGEVVLNPGNVAGLAYVLVNNARTDQPSLIVSQQRAGNITSAAVFEIFDSSGDPVFAVAGSGAPGWPTGPGPNGVTIEGDVVPATDNTFNLGHDTGTSSGNFGWLNIIGHNHSWIAGDGTVTAIKSPATGANLFLVLPNAAPSAVGNALVVNNIAGSTYTLAWGGASGCPGGSTTEIQYNNGSGGCSGDADLLWDPTAKALLLTEKSGGSTGRDIQLAAGGTGEVFGVNGSAASVLPGAIFSLGGIVPEADDAATVGAGSGAFKQSYTYDTYAQRQFICPTGSNFSSIGVNSCPYLGTVGTAFLNINTSLASGNPPFVQFVANSLTSQFYAQFNGAVIPNVNNHFSLGTGSFVWSNTFTETLTNVGGSTSINGLTYNWPNAQAAGYFHNDGSGNISFTASAGGVSSLDGLTGALNLAGAGGISISQVGSTITITGPGGGVVNSLNSLTGALSIVGTPNEISVTPSGSSITLATPQVICTTCAVTFDNITGTTLGTFGRINVGSNISILASGIINTFQLTAAGFVNAGDLSVTGPGTSATISSSAAVALQVTGGATFGGGAAGIGSSGVAAPCSPPSVTYFAAGAAGQSVTRTVRNSAGTGTCTIIYTCGIETGGTC